VISDIPTDARRQGLLLGPLIADSLAMPAHWYYDRSALRRDYGLIDRYLAPRNPHPDSILHRSSYTPAGPRGDILRDQARFWGQRNIHYHQFLSAGENTLNLQLARLLWTSLQARQTYDQDDFLARYVDFMLVPGHHRDTYVEEYHRHFFSQYARGRPPRSCGGRDIHIGGLAPVGLICAFFSSNHAAARRATQAHVGFSHDHPEVMAAAGALVDIIFDVLADVPLRQAILARGTPWVSANKLAAWRKEPDLTVVGQRLSPACYIHDAFAASLYLAWRYADDFSAAVLANANLGGDNCHRGAVIGALLGATQGTQGTHPIPPHLINALSRSPSSSIFDTPEPTTNLS